MEDKGRNFSSSLTFLGTLWGRKKKIQIQRVYPPILPSAGGCRKGGKGEFLFSIFTLPFFLSRNVVGKEENDDKNATFYSPFHPLSGRCGEGRRGR